MTVASLDEIKALIRCVRDFPKLGIPFRDISPLLQSPQVFSSTIKQMAMLTPRPEAVAAIESRGLIFGTALALHWSVPLIPIRKCGKLPGQTIRQQYSLEYGQDSLEVQIDALPTGARVVVVDDLLATGGTAAAAVDLVRQLWCTVHEVLFLIELNGLGGRDKLRDCQVHSLITFGPNED